MYHLNDKYVNYFAGIFECAFDENNVFDRHKHLIIRDSFIEALQSIIRNQQETHEESISRFQRKPEIEDPILARYAQACCEYYCEFLGLPVPDWAMEETEKTFPGYIFVYPNFVNIEKIYRNTPPAFKKRGFLTDRNDYTFL